MHIDSREKQAVSPGNGGFDPAKHCRSSIRPQGEAVRKDLSTHAGVAPRNFVDEVQNIAFLPAPGCRLFDVLCCICVVCVGDGRVRWRAQKACVIRYLFLKHHQVSCT